MNIDLPSHHQSASHHCVFVVVPRFNLATLITMIETLRVGNYLRANQPFSWEVTCFQSTSVTASNGMTITTDAHPDTAKPAKHVFVLGSWGTEHREDKRLSSWLRRRARAGEAICAVELGCYLVARAGLLADKTITTHWSWISGFRERFDQTSVIEQLYTVDRQTITCAGGLAGVDLMLHLITEGHGDEFAREISDQILYTSVRPADAPQRRGAGQKGETIPPIVRQAMTLIEENVEEPLTVPEVATSVGLSQRQLERQFKQHVGCTIVQFGLLYRLQAARVLLISTQMSVRDISAATGFNSLSHFSHSFAKFFGRRPSQYRDGWPTDEAAPSWPGTLSDYLETLRQRRTKSR